MAESKEATPAWTYEHPGDHPDNKPPVTIVAVPGDAEKKDYEDRMNMALKAGQPDEAHLEPLKADPLRVQLVDPDKEKDKAGAEAVNYEEKTVPELKEIAAEKGVDLNWDDNKTEIIKKLKKAK